MSRPRLNVLGRARRRPGRLRSRLAQQRGAVLTELVVATSVGAVVVLGTVTFVDSSKRTSVRLQERVEMTQHTRGALGRIVSSLRTMTCNGVTEPPIIEATPTSVTFFAHPADAYGRPLEPGATDPGRVDVRRIEINQSTGVVRQQLWSGVDPDELRYDYDSYYGYQYSYYYFYQRYQAPWWAGGAWRTLASGLARDGTLRFAYSGSNYQGTWAPSTISTVEVTASAVGKSGFRPRPEALKLTQQVQAASNSPYEEEGLRSSCA